MEGQADPKYFKLGMIILDTVRYNVKRVATLLFLSKSLCVHYKHVDFLLFYINCINRKFTL